jgi:hypothetical protein
MVSGRKANTAMPCRSTSAATESVNRTTAALEQA